MAYGVTPASASIGFLIGLGSQGLRLPTVAALLVGGLIAAPVAAWLVRVVPPRWPPSASRAVG